MYEWLPKVTKAMEENVTVELARSGASEKALAAAEKTLGVPLSPSHRAFLQQWNGGTLAHRILSVEDVIENAKAHGFKKRGAKAEKSKTHDDYYQDKPAHHLIVGFLAHSSEAWCLDTAKPGEYPLHWYDAEDGFQPDRKPKYPSFEALLLHTAVGQTSDAKAQKLLKDILAKRGVRNLDDILDFDWTAWK